ncbi:hypothetical protein ASPSYDRAFT_87978 [Aspergillus sydowii CBS 593.65]|uniref:Cytochrome P450 n=1 Tax=Aspergillus sydowii CBS 593.65 TaxID=1036612 RepID=A0A1L9TPS8_9EURO|nr:uncharacterized protein ASPSYDRAFT_87978 [Aspergillus sydowii CBS 593.65]OJJ61434.1 hypothetical protein ASPSYDRAFT_87978 [Aspergillus sydowii CBS 593.65]
MTVLAPVLGYIILGYAMIYIPEDEILRSPVESITRALKEHGPIIEIEHNKNRKYLVSQEYTRRVLTDETSFSFEHGIGKPIFQRGAAEIQKEVANGQPIDILPCVQATTSEAIIEIFLGQEHVSTENIATVTNVAESIAELVGLFQNHSFMARNFPNLWHAFTWIDVVLVRLPFSFGPSLGWTLWKGISKQKEDIDFKTNHDESLLSYLRSRYRSADGHLSFTSRLWVMTLILTIFFASVHQTVTITVWVTLFAALHPDAQTCIREELTTILPGDKEVLDLGALKRAEFTDSFIREVLRMKGDTVNVVRSTVRDVELGGYIIPKGYLVFPVTYLSYRSPEFIQDNPDEFHPGRWVGAKRTAGMTGTGNLAFGMGRWACPGRFLAVAELKMWLLALCQVSSFELEHGKYEVVDPMNITSVPPRGRIMARQCSSV